MTILKFKEFLFEFNQTEHFSNRSNINKEKEIPKKKKGDGSRMLPFEYTPLRTGYKILGMVDVNTGPKKSEPDLTYEDWLDMMDVNKESFEKFISALWNYQANHRIIQNKKGRPGKYYVIIPGMIIIKTEGYLWRPVFNTGEGGNSQLFIFHAVGDNLTTLYPTTMDVSRESLLRKIYDHFYREDKGNFRERFQSPSDFKLGENLEIIDLAKNIIVEFKNGNQSEIDIAKEKIDTEYSSGNFDDEPAIFIPPPSLIPQGIKETRKQIGKGDSFIYQGPDGKDKVDFIISSIENMSDIKKAQSEKRVGDIESLLIKGKKRDWTGTRFYEIDYNLELRVGDELSIYELVNNKRSPVKYFIGKLINSEPRIINQNKVQMWLYPIKYKNREENENN